MVIKMPFNAVLLGLEGLKMYKSKELSFRRHQKKIVGDMTEDLVREASCPFEYISKIRSERAKHQNYTQSVFSPHVHTLTVLKRSKLIE